MWSSPTTKEISLYNRQTIIENYSQSKCRVVEPRHIYKTTPTQGGAQMSLQKRGVMIVRARGSEGLL